MNVLKRLLLSNFKIMIIIFLIFVTAIYYGDSYIYNTDKASTKQIIQPDKRISFATWGTPKDMEVLKLVAQEFYNRYNIWVDVYCYPSEECCRTKVISQFAAGDPFDIFYTDDVMFTTLAKKGYLMDLTYLESSKEIKKDDYYKTAYNKGRVYGKLLGIPADINPYVIYYNKDLFKKSGISSPQNYYQKHEWNLDTLVKVCRDLKASQKVYGMAIKNDWQMVFSILNCDNDDKANFDKDGIIISKESSLRALKNFKSMIDDGCCLYMDSLPKGVSEDELFRSQRVGMIYGNYSYASLFSDIKNFNWDIIPFPSISQDCKNNAINVSLISAAKTTNEKEAVEAFILFYTGSAGQTLRFEKGEKTFPSLKYAVNNDPAFPEHSNYYFFSLTEGFMEPVEFNYLQNKNKLFSRLNHYWSGSGNLEDVVRIR